MLKQIFQFFAANPWVFIPIFVGVVNGSARLKQKLDEQKLKRDIVNEQTRRKQEALRTGRGKSQSAQSPPLKGVTSQRTLSPEEARKARIEALRQERLEQLRALREKRSAQTATQAGLQIGSQSSAQRQRMIPPQSTPSSTPKSAFASAQSAQRPSQSQSPKQRQRQIPKQGTKQIPKQGQGQTNRRRTIVASTSAQQATRRRKPKAQSIPAKTTAASVERTIRDQSIKQASTPSSKSARSMLRSKKSIRQAMVIREIIDTPIGLRDSQITSGSVFEF